MIGYRCVIISCNIRFRLRFVREENIWRKKCSLYIFYFFCCFCCFWYALYIVIDVLHRQQGSIKYEFFYQRAQLQGSLRSHTAWKASEISRLSCILCSMLCGAFKTLWFGDGCIPVITLNWAKMKSSMSRFAFLDPPSYMPKCLKTINYRLNVIYRMQDKN